MVRQPGDRRSHSPESWAGSIRGELKSFLRSAHGGGAGVVALSALRLSFIGQLRAPALRADVWRKHEPLGLASIGRGFDVKVSAPFGREAREGLQQVAAECVKHCPTGAFVFRNGKPGAALTES